MTYPPLYLQFFRHYHNEEYWEAHEVLEELWQTQRHNDFYHGLIQIAAIMHQLKRGKVRGARKAGHQCPRLPETVCPAKRRRGCGRSRPLVKRMFANFTGRCGKNQPGRGEPAGHFAVQVAGRTRF